MNFLKKKGFLVIFANHFKLSLERLLQTVRSIYYISNKEFVFKFCCWCFCLHLLTTYWWYFHFASCSHKLVKTLSHYFVFLFVNTCIKYNYCAISFLINLKIANSFAWSLKIHQHPCIIESSNLVEGSVA